MTGVGYAALHQVRALLARRSEEVRLFAVRARGGPRTVPEDLLRAASRVTILPRARRLKLLLWSRLEWPPLEWFCGPTDIAHELFHQVPAARRAARVATVHDLSVFRHPETHTPETVRIHTALLRHCATRADAIVAVSDSCRRDLIELLDAAPEKVHVVPNGVCLEEFEDELDTTALDGLKERLGIPRRYLIHLGTVEPRKNLPRLLRAYSRLCERVADCPGLVLVGKIGWKADPVISALGDPRLRDRVVHVGYLPRREALLLLRGASACAYPSLYEGFGLPVLEAMAARTPVITSNVSALPDVTGDTALLVDPHDEEALTHAMVELIERPEEARRRAEAARERAQRFTWSASADALVRAYRHIVEAR